MGFNGCNVVGKLVSVLTEPLLGVIQNLRNNNNSIADYLIESKEK